MISNSSNNDQPFVMVICYTDVTENGFDYPAKKIMFSTVSVCLSVKKLTKNYRANLYEIYGMAGRNQGPILIRF